MDLLFNFSKNTGNKANLSTIRVVQKNLLFVIGFSQRLSQDDLRFVCLMCVWFWNRFHVIRIGVFFLPMLIMWCERFQSFRFSLVQLKLTVCFFFVIYRKEFTKYGKIIKMVINPSSAYVTYTKAEDAVAAIKSLNELSANNCVGKNGTAGIRGGTANAVSGISTLRASLGTTKYCTHWLRSQSCPKQPDCK